MRNFSSASSRKLPALHDRRTTVYLEIISIIYICENCMFESNTRKLAFILEIKLSSNSIENICILDKSENRLVKRRSVLRVSNENTYVRWQI